MQIKNICDVLELHKNPRNPLQKRWFFCKISDNSHLKFGKMEKAKQKKHFRQPVNRKPTFFAN